MTRASITWGAGLSVALRSLPSMLIPPALAAALPAILAQVLSPDSTPEVVQAFLELPTPVQVFISLILLRVSGRAINDYQRRVDRRKLGPDVVEVPRLKLKWPGNLDYIPFVVGSRASDYCGGHWEGLVEKHGTIFNPGVFGGDQIMTVEPEHIKSILSTDFNSYGKGKTCFILIGPAFKEMTFTVLGNGVFNVDGEIWKFHRSMTRPYFSRDRISHFDNFARHSDAAIAKILSRLAEPAKPGLPSAVDFQDVVARFTLDSGTEFLFGRDVQSLEAPLPYPHEKPTDASASFAASFGRAQELIVYRMGLARLWSWMELFWDRTREDMDVINAYVTPILKKKLEDKRASGAGVNSRSAHGEGGEETLEEGPDTLLDHLVQFTDDETIIKDEVINILVAARDTAATTLTFAAYMLAENPEIMSRLRSEVLGRLGTSNYPTPEDFKEMKYLRAVLNETLRLFPAVPLNERAAVKSTVLQSNGKKYYVPAGAGIGYSVIYMHRRKDLWGPDADVFDPDRWLDDRLKRYVTPNPFIFLPFNAGPRICIGQQFAYNEASYFLCRLLQRIQSIELAPEAQPSGTLPPTEWKNGSAKGRRAYEKVWPKSHLTLYCNGGLWVRMKEASPIAE